VLSKLGHHVIASVLFENFGRVSDNEEEDARIALIESLIRM
jgi:hypothetical protein